MTRDELREQIVFQVEFGPGRRERTVFASVDIEASATVEDEELIRSQGRILETVRNELAEQIVDLVLGPKETTP